MTAFTTPPEKRPNSAEMAPVETVVSCTASSMTSGTPWPRMFSLMTTPLTMKRFSKVMAPLMVMVVDALSWELVLGPVLKTPGANRIVELSDRSEGSDAISVARIVVVTGAVCAKRSICPVTVTVSCRGGHDQRDVNRHRLSHGDVGGLLKRAEPLQLEAQCVAARRQQRQDVVAVLGRDAGARSLQVG